MNQEMWACNAKTIRKMQRRIHGLGRNPEPHYASIKEVAEQHETKAVIKAAAQDAAILARPNILQRFMRRVFG